MEYRDYVILIDENGQPYLAHHGIKGQKWGVRRFQNPDGTWTDAGKKRYENEDGTLNAKGVKALAKQAYKEKKRDINKRAGKLYDEYEKKKDENLYGLDSGGVGDRLKKHIKNEYEYEQKNNKLYQERLDAKREYRKAIGKKRVDTLLMKMTQAGIDQTSNESLTDYTKSYVKHAITNAADVVVSKSKRND